MYSLKVYMQMAESLHITRINKSEQPKTGHLYTRALARCKNRLGNNAFP